MSTHPSRVKSNPQKGSLVCLKCGHLFVHCYQTIAVSLAEQAVDAQSNTHGQFGALGFRAWRAVRHANALPPTQQPGAIDCLIAGSSLTEM